MQLCFPVISQRSEIHIHSSLEDASFFFSTLAQDPLSTIVLLAEKAVANPWASLVLAKLEEQGSKVHCLFIEGGEACKSRETKAFIEDFLFEKNIGREDKLLVLGGGTLLDLGGFVASTYLRGIALVFLPTTLLAMVDASFGGKTGINANNIKNCLGTFYPAVHILINTQFLSTLSPAAVEDAFPEICKYALIYDPHLFRLLQTQKDLWQMRDQTFLKTLLIHCIRTKKTIVEQDFQEKGLRRILNFGHTIGHAIEGFFADTHLYSHGEAVAIGLYIESYLSYLLKILSREDLSRICALLQDYGWPKIKKTFTYQDLLPFLHKDKKSLRGEARFVVLSSIGSTVSFGETYCTVPNPQLVEDAIVWFMDSCVKTHTQDPLQKKTLLSAPSVHTLD